ncbi:MAG TPA: phage portal protein [Lachnospiraceae bacterium]|nr:phage portal protein [Lachnospiraceae bacterium]
MGLIDRLQHGWNAFMNKDPTYPYNPNIGAASYDRPDRSRLTRGNERSMITTIYSKFSTDVAAIDIKHVRLDDSERYIGTVKDSLNYCLTTEANKDQTSRMFKQDIVLKMLDDGCVAIVPIDTNIDPKNNNVFNIVTMRTAQIINWYPDAIRIRVYNDRTGLFEEMDIPKSMAAIVENPFYAIMNETNSTMQRLKRKLAILDVIDDRSGSDKLDLIIQLPYTIKSEMKREQAKQRRKDIADQLASSDYGIAYIDSTEHVTQLNRSVENNLLKQVEYFTNLLYSQLGITVEILNGTADENAMNNYYNRVIEPLVSAIVDEMNRKFLTKTARTQMHAIKFFRDPFKLVSTTNLAELADKFTRNCIMTSNEFRQVVGLQPVDDPMADQLRNNNLSASNAEIDQVYDQNETEGEDEDEQYDAE